MQPHQRLSRSCAEDDLRPLGTNPSRTFHAKLAEDPTDVYRIVLGTGKGGTAYGAESATGTAIVTGIGRLAFTKLACRHFPRTET